MGDSTVLSDVIASETTAMQANVSQLNLSLISDYTTQFNAWSVRVLAGNITNVNPPLPANGYVVGFIPDPTNAAVLWPYAAIGTTPVCSPLPVPPTVTHPTGMMMIGSAENQAPGWWNALLGDTTPYDGVPRHGVSQDGVSGTWIKYGGPGGPGWFYLVAKDGH